MIRVLMLDLGETLVHGNSVFPHVVEALEVLSRFEVTPGVPLTLCLVSDFKMPTSPVTKKKIDLLFKEYISILDGFGLTKFFEPVERHVTLSTHVGMVKPAREVFEAALGRLGIPATLDECLFITENAEHILKCRTLGMKTLLFDPANSPGADFSDWAEAPPLINQLIGSNSVANLEAALRLLLAAEHEMELTALEKKSSKRSVRGRAKKLQPVSVSQPDGTQKTKHVRLTVDFEAELDEDGRVRSVKSGQPNPQEVSDVQHYLQTLEVHQRIAHHDGPLKPGETHQDETDEKGRTEPKRKRFSAI